MWRLPTSTPLQTQMRVKPAGHVAWSTDPPIYRLPVELLGKIFLLLLPRNLAATDKISVMRISVMRANTRKPLLPPAPHRTLWQKATEAPSWTDILYVCQHWRAVAVNYPALWTQLTQNPAWLIECIRRSRQMPLELYIEQTEANLRGALMAFQMVIPHFHRVREATIVAGQHDFLSFVFKCFKTTPAPRLETLSLSCGGCTEADEDFDWLEDPEFLFAHQMPNLRSLALDHYCRLQIPPSAPLFCSVTYLEISEPLLWKPELMVDVVSCMANWTALETLVLNNALPWELVTAGPTPPYPMPTPEQAHKITLPHLKRIHIDDEPATSVDHFLRYLVLPPFVSLYLDCELFFASAEWGAHDVDPAVVALSLLENVPATVVRAVEHLRVGVSEDVLEVAGQRFCTSSADDLDEDSEDDQDEADAQLKAMMSACPSLNSSTPWTVQLNLWLNGNKDIHTPCSDTAASDAAGPYADFFSSILNQLNLAHLRHLEFWIDRHFSKETWLRVLGPMRRLESLRFQFTGVGRSDVSLLHGFLDAFAGDVSPENGLHPGDVVFSSISHLIQSFLLPRLVILDIHVANFTPAKWRHLLAVLRYRCSMGIHLDMLIAWGEESSRYRPDERTSKELNEVLDIGMTWEVVDEIRACDPSERVSLFAEQARREEEEDAARYSDVLAH
ncbi:hypothetical protein DENSPDRAFT_839069 [Dentipellis sp. KUC8613]|nr:hypothetical protein DENSPDRAFT_839069 [Dentipellis sp. KUC8613]